MLMILTTILSLILHIVITWRGLSTETAVELSLQKCYFIFLFIQTFLMISLSFSITVITQDLLHDLDFTLTLLVKNLLKASNYFFSYLTLQDLSVSAAVLLQSDVLFK